MCAVEEARALDEVRSVEQRGEKARNLGGIGRAVSIQHDDDVAAGRREAACQRISLAEPCFQDDSDVWAQCLRHLDGVVHRMTVDEHDLIVVSGRSPRRGW
jgi:hypothetical protein